MDGIAAIRIRRLILEYRGCRVPLLLSILEYPALNLSTSCSILEYPWRHLEFRGRKPPYLVTKFGVVVEILDALAARFEFRNGQLGYRRAKWEFTRAKRQSSGCELKPTCGSRGVFEGGRIVLADLSRPPGDGAGRRLRLRTR